MRHDIIIEFFRHGNALKVTAIDPISGIEASIVGDPNASDDHLKKLAVQKLDYVIRKMQS